MPLTENVTRDFLSILSVLKALGRVNICKSVNVGEYFLDGSPNGPNKRNYFEVAILEFKSFIF